MRQVLHLPSVPKGLETLAWSRMPQLTLAEEAETSKGEKVRLRPS
jgi:hypothetical protein